MTIKVNFQNFISSKKIENLLLILKDKTSFNGLEKIFKDSDIELIKNFYLNNNEKNKKIISYNLNPTQKIIIIQNFVNNKNGHSEIEKFGAKLYEFLLKNCIDKLNILQKNIKNFSLDNPSLINELIHGMQLRSYKFDKYKNKKSKNDFLLKINLIGFNRNLYNQKLLRFSSIAKGVEITKDLVSEPGNILHPDEYAKRISQLGKIGLKINILDKQKLKKLGMNALLGVGQGSSKGSYLISIEWNGLNKKTKPMAFVGKGVCFDTGGISLKPAKFMEDMTYDMAGSAVVVGLMKTLALRKAKVNAVGVVGLVENMPDGNAQRPGDIVKSYSGKTIEILNTDAEGRLVLADALTYTEKKYKPKFIVDLATLTGAIIVSLGSEYAGLFSNDDKISDQLSKAGEKVGEKVWRMPLNDNYDKLIDSKKADMQNINYVGGAGSTTAAQFLQRFILNKTPWAHLDIAGMAFSKYGGALNSGGATGYGVRLLNQLIEDNYE
jgi:leucyl aminopeptidase